MVHNLEVKLYLGQNEDCSPGGSTSDSSERLLQRGSVCVCVRVCVLVAQSCPTLCDPMDYNPPGSSVHGILQARILEWVAISLSKREAVAEGQYVRFGEGGVPCNQALTLQEVFC